MRATTGLFLLMLFGYSKSLSNTRCVTDYYGQNQMLCFTQPDPMVSLSWSSAARWCEDNGGTLPIPDNSQQNTVYGNILGYFGLHRETLWLGADLTYDQNNWFWTNGSRFTGSVDNSNIPGKTHAYIVRNGSDVRLAAASPTDNINVICQYPYYSDISCASNYQNSYWTRNKCYVKTRYFSSWTSGRSYCGQSSMPLIDDVSDFSRWLEDQQTYWIGLRSSWWTWHNTDTGRSYEVMENRFGNANDMFSATAGKCMASYRDSNGNVYWTSEDCNRRLTFICQYNADNYTTRINTRPATTTTRSTTRNTTYQNTTFRPITTSIPPAVTNANETNSSRPVTEGATVPLTTWTTLTTTLRDKKDKWRLTIFGIPIEFFVGLVGALLLTVIVWLAILTLCACKKCCCGGTKVYPEVIRRDDRRPVTPRQPPLSNPRMTTHSTTHQMIRVEPA